MKNLNRLLTETIKLVSLIFIISIIVIIIGVNVMVPLQINRDISSIVREGRACPEKIDKPIRIFGEINKELAISVISKIEYLENNPKVKEIHIILISNGGQVRPGLAICKAIQESKKPITIYAFKALSMAAIILASGDKGKRWIKKTLLVTMIHLPFSENKKKDSFWSKLGERITYFTPDRIYKKMFIKILSEKSSQDIKTITKCLEDETWFTAEEAVEFGLADYSFSRL